MSNLNRVFTSLKSDLKFLLKVKIPMESRHMDPMSYLLSLNHQGIEALVRRPSIEPKRQNKTLGLLMAASSFQEIQLNPFYPSVEKIEPENTQHIPIEAMKIGFLTDYLEFITKLLTEKQYPITLAPIFANYLLIWSDFIKLHCESIDVNNHYMTYAAFGSSIKSVSKLLYKNYFPSIDEFLFQCSTGSPPSYVSLYPKSQPLKEKVDSVIAARKKMEEILNDTVKLWNGRESSIHQGLFQPLYSLMTRNPEQHQTNHTHPQHHLSPDSPTDISTERLTDLINQINEYITDQYNDFLSEKPLLQKQNIEIYKDLMKEMSYIFQKQPIIPNFILFGSRISGLATSQSDLDVSLFFYQMTDKEANNNTNQRTKTKQHPTNLKNPSNKNLPIFPLIAKAVLKQYIAEIQRKIEESSDFRPSPYKRGVQVLYKLQDFYKERSDHSTLRFSFVEGVYHARSPVAKLKHKKTGLPIDIGVDTLFGPQNTFLIQQYCQSDPRIHQLLLLVKQWVSRRSINSGFHGFISSFSWCLVTIHFLLKFQEFFQAIHNGMNHPERLRTIFVPEYHWTEHGREIIRLYRNDLVKFHSLTEEDLEKELFQLILPELKKSSSNIILDNSITTGELFLWFFVFYGTSPNDNSFSFDIKKEVRLTDETLDIIAGTSRIKVTQEETDDINNDEDSSNYEQLKIFDPLQNISLGRTMNSIAHQNQIISEFRRNAILVLNHISSSSSLSSSSSGKDVFDEMMQTLEPLSIGVGRRLCSKCSMTRTANCTNKSCPRFNYQQSEVNDSTKEEILEIEDKTETQEEEETVGENK
eukprot:gene2371-2518_t